MINITAAILAQGKNSRIGLEKSLLKITSESIIENEIKLLRKIFQNIIIISSKDELKSKFKKIPFYDDIYKNIGPLGGIHSALINSFTDATFVFACDMPNLSEEIILRQIELYQNCNCDLVVPRHYQGIEPLHGIYTKKCIPNIENRIKNKDYSIRHFYRGLNLHYLEISENQVKHFFNVNTLKDYYSLKKII